VTEAIAALADVRIEEWRPDSAGAAPVDDDIDMLGEVLHAVVHGGARVSFFVPFSLDEARAFWRDTVLPGVRARTRRVVIARRGPRIVGTVQLDLAVPPNQRHRAEVTKMLVHPTARRRGIARALMGARADRAVRTADAAHPRHRDRQRRGAALSISRLHCGWRHPALRARIAHAGARSGDDHVQGAARAALMNDQENIRRPPALDAILAETAALGFTMASEPKVGAFLAALAASKPGGRFLELGTGTGHGTAWILAGMDASARLETVDTDPDVVAVARRHLAADSRVTFHVMDGAALIGQSSPDQFDLIYADAWPGKFTHLDEALALLRAGGMYVIDDLLPQPNWPDGHAVNVAALIESLEAHTGFITVQLAWASGLMIVVRTGAA
jgi:predicted O-methyltransferase YrrM/GNAT superfamily N-acetyltransferase